MTSKTFILMVIFKGKLYVIDRADRGSTACVSNDSERDAAVWRRRRAAEVDARCVSQTEGTDLQHRVSGSESLENVISYFIQITRHFFVIHNKIHWFRKT